MAIDNGHPRKGKVTMTGSIDGQSLDQMFGGTPTVYVCGTFLIEYNTSIHFSGMDSATGKVVQFKPDDPRYKELTSYSVTDLISGTVSQFNKNLDSPQILASYPLSQKKEGYLIAAQKEIDILKDGVKRFHFVKDTIIDQVKYKILEDTASRKQGRATIQKSVAYLNPAIKNFPVKLSTFLDNKFGGWVNKVTLFAYDSATNRKQIVTIEQKFDPNLDSSEIKTIELLARLTKERLASKK